MVNPKTTNPWKNGRLHDVVYVVGLESESSPTRSREFAMADRIERKVFVQQLANRIQTDEQVALEWLEAILETLYTHFKIRNERHVEGIRRVLCPTQGAHMGFSI